MTRTSRGPIPTTRPVTEMDHTLTVTDHETARWCRAECTRCGAKHTIHSWDLKQDMGEKAFAKDICVPPPPISVAYPEGTTCVEDRKRTT